MHLPTPYFNTCLTCCSTPPAKKNISFLLLLPFAFFSFPFSFSFLFLDPERGVLELRRIRRGEGSERERKVKKVDREKGRNEKAGKKKKKEIQSLMKFVC
jgi:hypothetical protein